MRFPTLSFILLLLLSKTLPDGVVDPDEWQTVPDPLSLEFPRDHGSHPAFQTEWWYVTGNLEADGRLVGFQLTFFRRGLDSSPKLSHESAFRPRQMLIGHLALLDVENASYLHAERMRRTGLGLASAAEDDLHVILEDWEMKRLPDGSLHLVAFDRDSSIGLDLIAVPGKPLVLHGEKGRSAKGPGSGNASAYVSMTRLQAKGKIVLSGEELLARGECWFDHEFGTSQLGPEVVGWDWFALRFSDDEELMVYRLRRADGTSAPFSGGTFVDASGEKKDLKMSQVSLTATGSHVSLNSGARYPQGWRIQVKDLDLDLILTSPMKNAEMDARRSVGMVYWEGLVRVTGSRTGIGFVELTGYHESISGRF